MKIVFLSLLLTSTMVTARAQVLATPSKPPAQRRVVFAHYMVTNEDYAGRLRSDAAEKDSLL